MNLDELQSVQARERQSSDLQHLRASFYREVGEFIGDLVAERAAAVEAAGDPFADPEVRRLSDDIETAEQTVEAIYERRVGKVVKKASIAAAGMPVDDDGLTDEEADLFDDLVDRIERNRDSVLSALEGEAESVSPDVDPLASGVEQPPSEDPGDDSRGDAGSGDADVPEGVSAADLMGDAEQDDTREGEPGASESVPSERRDSETGSDPDGASSDTGDSGTSSGAVDDSTAPPAPDPGDIADGEDPPEGSPRSIGQSESDGAAPSTGGRTDEESPDGADPGGSAGESDVPGIPRTTVRITAEVGEVVGADDRDYDLSPEDVVTLPSPNAEVLLDKDAAERLE